MGGDDSQKGSWETTGVITAMSGDTLTVTAGRDVSGTGIGQDRADVIGGSLTVPAPATIARRA